MASCSCPGWQQRLFQRINTFYVFLASSCERSNDAVFQVCRVNSMTLLISSARSVSSDSPRLLYPADTLIPNPSVCTQLNGSIRRCWRRTAGMSLLTLRLKAAWSSRLTMETVRCCWGMWETVMLASTILRSEPILLHKTRVESVLKSQVCVWRLLLMEAFYFTIWTRIPSGAGAEVEVISSGGVVMEGDLLVFICGSCVPSIVVPTYIWKRDGLVLDQNHDGSNQFDLDPVRLEDKGQYSCMLSGHEGLKSSAVAVDVRPGSKSKDIATCQLNIQGLVTQCLFGLPTFLKYHHLCSAEEWIMKDLF